MTLWHVLDDVAPELPLVSDPAEVEGLVRQAVDGSNARCGSEKPSGIYVMVPRYLDRGGELGKSCHHQRSADQRSGGQELVEDAKRSGNIARLEGKPAKQQ